MAVYLFTGPELGEKQDAINSLKLSLQKARNSLEDHLFYANESEPSSYLPILESNSFFSSCVCVVVKNASLIKKKKDIASIASFIKDTTTTNTLILVADEVKVEPSLEKLIPPQNKKVFWEMFENKKIPFIQNFFSRNQYKITTEAASLILTMCENDTLTLKAECEKFFILFPSSHIITPEDVEAVLENTKEENAFSIFSALITYNSSPIKCLKRSLTILQKVRLSKDSSAVMLIAALASSFRKTLSYKKLQEENKLTDLNLRSCGIISKKQKEQYAASSRLWGSGSLYLILDTLSRTDIEARLQGGVIEDLLLQKMLYEIIIKKGHALPSYDISFPFAIK